MISKNAKFFRVVYITLKKEVGSNEPTHHCHELISQQ